MIPSQLLTSIRAKAKQLHRTIVFPDATDIRTLKAVRIIADEGIANPILIGNEIEIRKKAELENIPLNGIRIIEPSKSEKLSDFSHIYYNLRKAKGMQFTEAQTQMQHSLFFGAMMVKEGFADGSVAGSLSTTGDVLRAAIQIIGVAEGVSIVSSFFLMVFPHQVFSFADCAVVPEPDASQLADIAITTASNHQKLTGEEPKVAMLSFSTKGSATHPLVEKVQQATQIAKQKAPQLLLDGELQLDAAIISEIGKRKAPNSEVSGKANVLVFPDLNAGNIGYKLVERLGGAQAIGPLVQGLQKPAFDLSRGCSAEDIVNVAAICAVMK
ncbi:MAG: phosphate acetyltransferase [Ignavibacteriales bacterium]|nr:phosphate acetyltransferase [Ignavibacteriales bacterium]